jgi:mxaL protein
MMRMTPVLTQRLDRESGAIALAVLLLCLAFLWPVLDLPGASSDSVVVFDITQSMNVEDEEIDGEPVDRLTFARAAARRALHDLPCGSRVGWAVFAEYRTLLLLAPIEVCEHYNDLLATLDAIDGRMRWGNASEISKGAFWALRMAREVGGPPNVIFVSDGQEAPPLRDVELPLFDDIKPGEVHGWVVGVGGDTPRPIPKTDPDGRRLGFWRPEDVVQPEGEAARAAAVRWGGEHLSSLREPHLQALARQIGFDYARLSRLADLAPAMLDRRHATWRPVPTRLAWLPALVALSVLAWAYRPRGALR